MKRILYLSILLIGITTSAQVVIGSQSGISANKTSVLLEFADDDNKGIILPYVTTIPTSPTEGTILLDASSASGARVKYYNGSWVDLSGQNADITSVLSTQPTVADESGSKAIIGSSTTDANGVLILESKTKAMVLPTVSDVNNIPSPSPGMMVYVNKEGAKRLAVYNGAAWSFWKP